MTKPEIRIVDNTIQMYESLLEAIKAAGGSGDSFKPFGKLKEMSVAEMMLRLSTNKIRFICVRPEKKKRFVELEEDENEATDFCDICQEEYEIVDLNEYETKQKETLTLCRDCVLRKVTSHGLKKIE